MATHKCAAMIIEPNNSNQKFNFKLYNENIPLVEEQIFLGIKIDRHMKFDKHVDLICAKANSRINIIRILAHKSWKLKKSTLVNVYKTVLRSVIEYSSLINPVIKNKLHQRLQLIQNNALRIILNKSRETSIKSLHQMAKLDMVKDRLSKLCKSYIEKCIINDNPVFQIVLRNIWDMQMEEFWSMKQYYAHTKNS